MRVAFLQRIFAHYQWGLVRELAEHSEHEYSFLSDTRDPGRSGIEPIPADRLRQVRFRYVRTWQPGQRIAFQPSAVQVALSSAYDVLILEGAYAHPTTWAAMGVAQRLGKRVLLHTHGWIRESEPGWLSAVRTRFLRAADGLLLYGRRARLIGLDHGLSPDKMHVAFNCLDHARTQACRSAVTDEAVGAFRSAAFGDRCPPIVAYVGRLGRRRGLEVVLRALERLRDRNTMAGFLVIGDGPAAGDVRELSHRLRIPVHFTGAVYDEERLAVMLVASRVVVSPEAVGLMAVTAMSYGTPVVTHADFDHQMPEAEAVVPGVTGELFSRGDEHDLANKLSGFLGPDDPRARWARSCLRIVERFYNPTSMRTVFDRAVSGLPAVQPEALEVS